MDMPTKQCACGTSMDNVHNTWMCGHCDQPCEAPKPCGTCNRYTTQTQLRINEAARKDKPDTGPQHRA